MVFYFKYLKHKDTNTLTNTQIPPLLLIPRQSPWAYPSSNKPQSSPPPLREHPPETLSTHGSLLR